MSEAWKTRRLFLRTAGHSAAGPEPEHAAAVGGHGVAMFPPHETLPQHRQHNRCVHSDTFPAYRCSFPEKPSVSVSGRNRFSAMVMLADALSFIIITIARFPVLRTTCVKQHLAFFADARDIQFLDMLSEECVLLLLHNCFGCIKSETCLRACWGNGGFQFLDMPSSARVARFGSCALALIAPRPRPV